MQKKIAITYFVRKPSSLGNFSVETYYRILKSNLDKKFNIKIYELPFKSQGFIRRLLNCFFCYFHQGEINHIIGDIHYVNLFFKKKKTILTILDCVALHSNRGFKRLIFKLFWFTIPIMRSRIITGISNATIEDLKSHIKIPFDYEVIYFLTNSNLKSSSLNKIDKNKVKLLQIGTAANKNIERLAYSLSGLQCKLTIVGKLNYKQKESLKINNIDYEEINKRLTDSEIEDEYIKTDIVTYVSTLEGFGMPIIEANQIGRPIITSNLSSMPEIANDAAYLVNPFNIKDIRRGIDKLISNKKLREELVEKGKKNFLRFNANTISKQYANLYYKLKKYD